MPTTDMSGELSMSDAVPTHTSEQKTRLPGKKLVMLIAYFACTPVILVAFILYFLYLTHIKSGSSATTLNFFSHSAKYQALPDTNLASVESSVDSVDARERVLEEFLARYHSPLLPYTHKLIEAADTYGLDYRLLPAIAMQESNLCKKIPKKSAHNCWGFGIYGSKRTGFDNYDQAIDAVAKTLARDYVQQGLVEPEEIMTKYTPGSNGSWAHSVNFFMAKIHAGL